MADKLSLYNAALREIGQPRLASLSEGREGRYILDDVYTQVVGECLEEGQWNHAMRAVEVASEPGIDPAFGFTYAFTKPADWIRTAALCSDEEFMTPLNEYVDEIGYWWSDVDPIYVKYVSNDVLYGMNLADWPTSFERYVVVTLASRIVFPITQSDARTDYLKKEARRAKINARSKDAMNQASPVMHEGTWLTSRFSGARWRSYDKG